MPDRPRPLLRPASAALGALALALLVTGIADAAARRTLYYSIPPDTLERFSFEVKHSVQTSFERLPPEAEPFDVDSLKERLGSVDSTLTGTLERYVGRVFRDSSMGLITRMIDLQGTINRGDGPGPLEPRLLEAKSVIHRIRGSGELLDSNGWSHFSGTGQGGDLVFELMTQPVLRLPPKVPPVDGKAGTTFRLRVPIDSLLERDQNWVLLFTRAEAPSGCKRCVALDYTGEIRESSTDKHPARPMKLEAMGAVEGTIVLGAGRSARPLISHRWSFDWDRTTRSERANGTVRGEVRQLSRVSGRVWRSDP